MEKQRLIYQEGSDTIRQMPENYLVAHWRGPSNGWASDPDIAANPDLCVSAYRTIIHSFANKYLATGNEIADMANKLHERLNN
jgi:hypothetical protein